MPRFRIAPIHWYAVVFALAMLICALLFVPNAGAAPLPPEPKPCIGVVVKVISDGAELVKQKNGTICKRAAQGVKPSQQFVQKGASRP